MRTYKTILQNSEATKKFAQEFAQGFDFSEDEIQEFNYNSHDNRYIDTVEGVKIYYNWIADYYFFAPTEQ